MIGVWSSSSPADRETLKKALKALDNSGLEYIFPKESRKHAAKKLSASFPFLAGPDNSKVQCFEELWNNPEVSKIWATRGGYGTLRLLPLFDKLKSLSQPQKALWGYSDLTVLQHYLFERNGGSWVHSPMLCSSSFFAPTREEKKVWLSEETGAATKTAKPSPKNLKILSLNKTHRGKSSLRRRLLGGNLASLVSLMGTPWHPQYPSKTWLFLEEIGEAPYKLDRLLHQLASDGSFIKNVDGILLGHFTDCPGHLPVLKAWAEKFELTLLTKFKAGHESPNLPLILGESRIFDRKNETHFSCAFPKPVFG